MEKREDKTDISDLQAAVRESEKKIEQQEKKKQPPLCARCQKRRTYIKHHWPLTSSRVVPLCNHCFNVVKKQRKRTAKFHGGGMF